MMIKKISVLIASIGVTVSYASTIQFDNQTYEIKDVKLSKYNCSGDFGATLQYNLKFDPIKAIVSAQYDILDRVGNIQVSLNTRATPPFFNDTLIQGYKYEFNSILHQYIDVMINGHKYQMSAVTFATTGDNNYEWINNGNVKISFADSQSMYLCTVYSSPTNN